VADLRAELGDAGIAVLAPASLVDVVTDALTAAGIDFNLANRGGLDADVTVVPMALAKGLELDGVVLVEPARVVAEERQGLRALYVGLTRATKRLAVVHADPLPEALVDQS
jgi:superfamily I DNA/RNA helicase